MYSKLIALIIPLFLLMITVTPSNQAKAQGLVEYALILVLVPVGPSELAEITWLPQRNQGNAQAPIIQPGDTITFTIVVTNPGALNCTPEVVTTTVKATSGPNTLNLARTQKALLVNGQEHLLKDECLGTNNRVFYQVGVPFPPGLAAPDASNASALALKLPSVTVTNFTIVANGGGTAASSQFQRNNLGLFILDIGNSENP